MTRMLWRRGFQRGVVAVHCAMWAGLLAIKYAPHEQLAAAAAALLVLVGGNFAVEAYLFIHAARRLESE